MSRARARLGSSLALIALLGCDHAVIGTLERDASEVTRDAGSDAGDASAPLRCTPPDEAAPATPNMAYAGGAGAPTGNITEGRLNGGRQFEITADCIHVTELGLWDHAQDGLSRAHAVALLRLDGEGPSANPVATLAVADVQPGNDVSLEDGFRFAALAAPIELERGFYAVIAYDFSSEEPFADGGSEPAPGSGIRDTGFTPFEFTTAASPAYPASGDTNPHVLATFRYLQTTAE
jgi:hypothetical protein